jgi:hypothetical protein
MAKTSRTNSTKPEGDPIEKAVSFLEILVKLKLEEAKGSRSQRDMIRFLGSLQIPSGQIATLLGISRTTVDPELSKARSSKPKRK